MSNKYADKEKINQAIIDTLEAATDLANALIEDAQDGLPSSEETQKALLYFTDCLAELNGDVQNDYGDDDGYNDPNSTLN